MATYFNVKNFEVILSKDNRGSGATVEYISNESSSLKQQFLYISPQSDNNFIKIGFSVDESWKLGEIKIMCFDKEIYVGKVGVSE